MIWSPEELRELEQILAPLPPAFLENNDFLHVLERRDVLRDAPPDAPGHSMYEPGRGAIVVFDKGVYDGRRTIDRKQFRRSIYHELAHALLRKDPGLLEAWKNHCRGDGFVDSYAQKGEDEDFSDTFSEYLIDPAATTRAVPTKAQFLKQYLARARTQEKRAMAASIEAFADELCKLGAPKLPQGGLKSLVPKIPMLARMGLAGGVGAVAGHALGKRKGMAEGEAISTDAAREAYQMGLREGATQMQHAMGGGR